MRKLIRLALVASVLYGTGAHWAALQGGAWAGMIAARVSESSWGEAVASAFSGERPCRACKVVEKGTTRQSPMICRPGSSVDFAVTVAPRSIAVLPANSLPVSPLIPVASVSSRPFVPPPKTALPA